jgi:hypothetical protein
MNQPPPDDEDRGQGTPWLGLVVAILIVVVGVWVMVAFKKSSDTLDCVASGRHNCMPMDQ